jgi:hypothetical protein
MKRTRSSLMIALLAALVWSSASWQVAVPVRAAGDAYDLASLAISTNDLADGFQLIAGMHCLTARSCADPNFFAGVSADTLTEDGLVRAYALGLAQFVTDDPTKPERSVATTIAEYENADGARSGVETFINWLADPNGERSVSNNIGEDAQLFEVKGAVTGDAAATAASGLRFRIDTLVVGIEIRDYRGRDIRAADVEALGRIVAGRINDHPSGPGLGTMATNLRSTGSGYYVHRDGETVRLWRENESQYAARSGEFTSNGVENVYLTNQVLITGDDPKNPKLQMSVVVYELSSGLDASNYLAKASQSLADSWTSSDVTFAQPNDVPDVGDESVWFVNVYPKIYQATVYTRSGNKVARIIWQYNLDKEIKDLDAGLKDAQKLLMGGVEFVGDAEAGCLLDANCEGLTRLPSELLPETE